MTLVPVFLSGGVGSRLWPISRAARPKQFLPLTSDRSMLRETYRRLSNLECSPPIVVCSSEHRFVVAEQLREETDQKAAIILEPAGKNTAPAVALAAFQILKSNPDAVLLVLPSDHHVCDPEAFCQTVQSARSLAHNGKLMTFGVVPTQPETGYGYIRFGDAIESGIFGILGFKEKPDRDSAISYLECEHYLWNSGIFLFRADAYLEALAEHQPKIYRACDKAMSAAEHDLDFIRPLAKEFLACPSDSIDYAIMEHTNRGAVALLDCGWSDLGSWNALYDIGERDFEGNVTFGDVLLRDARNNYVHSEGRLIACSGIENMVVVETPDAVLVSAKDSTQEVKTLVEILKTQLRSEAAKHDRVHRPWGYFDSFVLGQQYQVKCLTVNSGQTLSLQLHHHRAEHWVVVSGLALITRGEESLTLGPDESTYIPVGMKHRLSNPGINPLKVIEVQSGSYLGEDDIVRFDDEYGRKELES